MVNLIDTHAHLYADEFDDDRDQMVERAKQAGVHVILLPNIDETSIVPLKKLIKQYPGFLFGMMGLHPCSVKQHFESALKVVENELFTNNEYIAVGEIGIDLYWDKSTLPYQQEAFKQQCDWAVKLGLPVAIHSRDSTALIIEMLKQMTTIPKGVFHCFTGSATEAHEITEMGMYLGIGGVLSFKNSQLKEVLPGVNPQKIILETDSPYLAPVPHRGKRNESAFTAIVAEHMAAALKLSPQEIAQITTANAYRLFNKLPH